MRIFHFKFNSPSPKLASDAAAEPAAPQVPESAPTPVGLGDMPPEIAAAIFGAIDVRDTVGVKAYDNLRATSRNFQDVGNDLLRRAITPQKEEADTDMASLREQLDGAWLAEDDSRDIHAARRHLFENARNRENKRTCAHRPMALKLHGNAIASSVFSPSGRFMAIGDQMGSVTLTDMQMVKQQASRHELPSPLHLGSPSVYQVPSYPGSAIALAFSADDSTLAVVRRQRQAVDFGADEPDLSVCQVVVYDLQGPEPRATHYVALPAVVDDISSVTLDARGANLVLAAEGKRTLVHVALSALVPPAHLGESLLSYVRVPCVCNGEVAYTNRGALMYGTRDGHQEALAAPKGAVMRRGTRRPFVMPRPSQLDRRDTADHASDDATTKVAWIMRDDQTADLQLSTFIDGKDAHVVAESITWDHRNIPSMLFAPGNRHVLVTSRESRHALLIDTAPPKTLEQTDEELEQAIGALPKRALEPHRRRPITSTLPGRQIIRHAFHRLRGYRR